MLRHLVSGAALALVLATPALSQTKPATGKPTAAEADAFVAEAEKTYAARSTDWARTAWVNATYITDDTDALAAKANAEATEMGVRYAIGAARFNGVAGVSADTRRKLDLMRNGLMLPAPTRPGAADQLATLTTKLSSTYGKGKGTLDG